MNRASKTARTLYETGRSLAVDLWAVEAASALGESGIPCILLKGASLQRLLYADGTPRAYRDVDLLISPESREGTAIVLSRLGYQPFYGEETSYPAYYDLWNRERDAAVIDLHWTLWGVGVGPAEVWRRLSLSTERIPVGGADLDALDRTACTFHIALHAARHGPAFVRSRTDLERALDQLGTEVWSEAAALAAELDATEAFAAGLRLLEPGRRLAEELGLPAGVSVETALLSTSAPPLSLGFAELAETPGLRGKMGRIRRELFPSREFMRTWWPQARRGRGRLALSYLQRAVQLLWRAPPALLAWRRAVRESRATRR